MKLIEGDLTSVLGGIARIKSSRWDRIVAANSEVEAELKQLRETATTVEGRRVAMKQLDRGYKEISKDLQKSLTELIQNLEEFYHESLPSGWELSMESAVFYKQRILPFKRIGIFVSPGASAALTLLHIAIPAKLAGVREIVLASPIFTNLKGEILFAYVCKTLGIKEMYTWSDVEAIHFFSSGAEDFLPVDRIFAVGGPRLQCAKRQAYGVVGLDPFFGAYEVSILIDETCDESALCRAIEAHYLAEPATHVSVFCVSNKKASDVINTFVDQVSKSSQLTDSLKAIISNSTHLIVTSGYKDAVRALNTLAPTLLYLFGNFPEELLDEITGPCYLIRSDQVIDRKIDPFLGPCFIGKTCSSARFSSTLKMINFTKSVDLITVDSGKIEAVQKISNDYMDFVLSDRSGS